MTRRLTVRVATWIFSRLVPEADREHVIGDLAEEYTLRAQTESSSAALRWSLNQICASIVPVVSVRLRRAAWPATLSVALLAYFAVGVVQLIVNWALPDSYGPTYDPLGLVVLFPAIVLIGYVAERSRRRAAIVLAAIMLLVVTALTFFSAENAPLWYWVALFVVGPLAALIGSALHSAPSRLSRR